MESEPNRSCVFQLATKPLAYIQPDKLVYKQENHQQQQQQQQQFNCTVLYKKIYKLN